MLNYIIANAEWIATFVGLEIIFSAIYLVWAKLDREEAIFNLRKQVVFSALGNTILVVAIICTGAPAWFTISIIVLSVISLASPLLLKWKYGL